MTYREQIDPTRVPAHVAIIMDGNGRWAKRRGEERSRGHQAGTETVKRIVEEAKRMGIKYLTLYTFSTENWKRPEMEVAALMSLLFESIEEEIFMKNNVAFRVIGDMERMPEQVRQRLEQCIANTAGNDSMTLVLALSYSSKWELTRAVRNIAADVKAGIIDPDTIDDTTIEAQLTTHFMPDPDLLIRTGGEVRLSNYLLWQCAYSELYFCDTLWPDFNEEELAKAICDFQGRERRFGKTSEQVTTTNTNDVTE
ncbi:MAG: isoprenyl transferase [Bacteroidaceae bacterium]|nr:isoprenyl transferase [Bacteroidaceae bacterium]